MARATILSSLGAGHYRVRLHFDNSRIEARLTHMAAQIADYTAEMAALEPDKIEKTTALNAALTALNDYINATDPAIYAADPTELNALNKATWTARGELDVILHDEKLLKLKKSTLEKETDLLNKLCPADFETNAWCVEYVEDLSGETEAIEVDYLLWRDVGDNQIEHDTGIWLPAATTAATNALIHPMASSEHATWFNLCMAPAAQRHVARYRVATLSNLSGNTCNIAFDGRYDVVRANGNVIDNAPIHPQLAEGQQDHYVGANIVYGTCNGAAFVNGDRVIVDLHSAGVPTVVGFYSDPRQCPSSPVIIGPFIQRRYANLIHHVFYSNYVARGVWYHPSLGVIRADLGVGIDVYYSFVQGKQQSYKCLYNETLTAPLGIDDYHTYSSGNNSASIPALLSMQDNPGSLTGTVPPISAALLLLGNELYNQAGVLQGTAEIVSYPDYSLIGSFDTWEFDDPRPEAMIENHAFTLDMGTLGTLPYHVRRTFQSGSIYTVEFADSINY